jgi:hypothetical protein
LKQQFYCMKQIFIAILNCVDDICRGAQLCAPIRRVLHPIETAICMKQIFKDIVESSIHFSSRWQAIVNVMSRDRREAVEVEPS